VRISSPNRAWFSQSLDGSRETWSNLLRHGRTAVQPELTPSIYVPTPRPPNINSDQPWQRGAKGLRTFMSIGHAVPEVAGDILRVAEVSRVRI
jgi:hypothetical protein